jgi:chitin-binding protein
MVALTCWDAEGKWFRQDFLSAALVEPSRSDADPGVAATILLVRQGAHYMTLARKLIVSSIAALAVAAIAVTAPQGASAHGSLQIVGSRNWLCYQDGLAPTGEIIPNNPACKAAVAKMGTTSLYNWFGDLRSDGAGRTRGFIPDGQLCSAGAVNFDFSGLDLVRNDWPVTHLTAGASVQFKYNKWAAHPGWFYLYVTKDGWDQSSPLAWSDFEDTFFNSADHPPSVGDPGSVNSYYYWTGNLPQKTGRHIIYSVWQRSDSNETFYGCSDVVFDGGNGQVTGVGPGGSSSGSPSVSTSASASASVSPSSSGGTAGCAVTYQTASSWSSGFQGTVTVTNNGTAAVHSWTLAWAFTGGQTITQSWNTSLTQSGASVTATSVSYNGGIPAGGSTSFGFLGSGTAPGSLSGVTCATT